MYEALQKFAVQLLDWTEAALPDDVKKSLSMPLFLHPRSDVLLKENFTAEQYLTQRLTEFGVY